MNVDISSAARVTKRVWFDASCGKLFFQAGHFVNAIEFAKIPDADFASKAAVKSFSIGQYGSVVICHHRNAAETWLSADMWLPEGFTPETKRDLVSSHGSVL